MGTFLKEKPGPNDPIIAVTVKFRAKLKADGTKQGFVSEEINRQNTLTMTHGVQLPHSEN